MSHLRKIPIFLCVLAITLLPSGSNTLAAASAPLPGSLSNTPIQHLVVIMQENHTFDNYFGTYPGADGIPAGTCMPANVFDNTDAKCVEPYHIGDSAIEDLDHSLSTFRLQYNNGGLNGFVYALNQRNQHGAQTMGYYDGSDLPYYWNLADEFVLFDRFFSSEHGGSFSNHMYWVTGQPGGRRPSEQGYSDIVTIFDRLEERGISWKFYIQKYEREISYRSPVEDWASQVIWVPLLSMDRFLDDPKYADHVVDLTEYYTDLKNGTLPAVSYIVPSGASEHPPGSVQTGQKFVKSLIQGLMRSEAWDSSAFLLLYDDWGGWYDHVVPPQVDSYGYGFRVPALLISSYARRGHVDSTVLDFTSVLKFIEENWDIEPLAARDAKANNFLSAFDFSQPSREAAFIPFDRVVKTEPAQSRRTLIYATYGAALLFACVILAGAALARGGRLDPAYWTRSYEEDKS